MYRCLLHVAEEFHEIPNGAVQIGKKKGSFIIALGGETHILRANIRAPRPVRRKRLEGAPPAPGYVGCTGVRWDSSKDRWIVQIRRNGRRIWIGSFLDENGAIKALEAATPKQ